MAQGVELAYLFDLGTGGPALTAQQRVRSGEMIRLWTRFARDGDPGPPWPWFNGAEEILTFTPAGPVSRARADVRRGAPL